MVVLRVDVKCVVVARTQNFQSPAARGSGTRGSGRVVVVRTQNFLRPATRGSGTHGSVSNVSGTNAKFSKSSRAC